MRYERQTILPNVGDAGQEKLGRAHALVVGAGGLGSPVVLYLAGAGVGRIDVCDPDVVDETNLHRQVLYTDADVGQSKAAHAARRVRAMGLASAAYPVLFQELEKLDLRPDVILDCTDRFRSHDAVITAGLRASIPVVHGSLSGLSGRVITFRKGSPCWQCINPEKPDQKSPPSGTLGPICGILGSMMVLECLRVLLGWQVADTALFYDAFNQRSYKLETSRRIDCPNCARTAENMP